MQVVGYTRVSTSEQAADGVSLRVQAEKVSAYSVVKDWDLVDIITDEGQSAKSLARPGLQQLLSLVDAGQVDVVIIYKLDRLTRSVADLDRLMKLFESKDVALGVPARKPRRHNRDRPSYDEFAGQCEPVGTGSDR
jgi:site-specific DNA recombinase